MTLILLKRSNAQHLTSSTKITPVGSWRLASPQIANANLPILATEAGMTALRREVHPGLSEREDDEKIYYIQVNTATTIATIIKYRKKHSRPRSSQTCQDNTAKVISAEQQLTFRINSIRIITSSRAYVGILTLKRAEQPTKVLLDISTRLVGSNTSTR